MLNIAESTTARRNAFTIYFGTDVPDIRCRGLVAFGNKRNNDFNILTSRVANQTMLLVAVISMIADTYRY